LLDTGKGLWYNVLMMQYDENIPVRVPARLKEQLQKRAEILKVPVSTIVRWALCYAVTDEGMAAVLEWMWRDEDGEKAPS